LQASCHHYRIILKPGRKAGFIFCVTHHHSGVDLITELVTIGIVEQDGVAEMTEFLFLAIILPAIIGGSVAVILLTIYGEA
jgi:hypothetical protein